LKAELEAVSSTLAQKSEESVIGLVDTRHTVLSMAMTVIIEGYARRIGRHIRKAAVMVDEVSPTKKNLLSAIARVGGRTVVLFDDAEAAKDWLVDD
jgi:hypothetical protein